MGTDSKGPIDWHLRALMAEAGMFQTTELLAPLREQVEHFSWPRLAADWMSYVQTGLGGPVQYQGRI